MTDHHHHQMNVCLYLQVFQSTIEEPSCWIKSSAGCMSACTLETGTQHTKVTKIIITLNT